MADKPVVGREAELAAVREFIDGPALVPALVLTGAAGIGKTKLWEEAVGLAVERGWNVLVARAGEAEVALSFASLSDLLDRVPAEALAGLVPPQQRALEVALARTEPTTVPPEPLAIAAGLLSLLRLPAMGERILIALDDAQWLDPASAAALAFAARRVLGERVRLLLTIRTGHTSVVEREIASRRIDLGAMGVLDARRLVLQQLGLSVPRPLMGRLVEAAHGNPLMVLELGRLLVEHGTLELAAELPLPELAHDLFGARVRALPATVNRSLLATALGAHLSRSEIAALYGPTALEEATAHGVLMIEGDRVRAVHPLLAAAAIERATVQEREAAHLELSRILGDGPRGTRHLALATPGANAERAAILAAAAAAARRRGAARDAVELAQHALRMTPAGDPETVERVLTLGAYLMSAGEVPRLRELLADRFDELPRGAPRGRAHLLLADVSDARGHEAHLEQAITESGDEPVVRAVALAAKVMLTAVMRVERIAEAEADAEQAVAAGRAAGPAYERRAISALAWTRVLRARPIDDLERSSPAPDDGTSLYEASIERVGAARHGFRGEIDQARDAFEHLLEAGEDRGESISGEIMLLHLCELALRAGDCNRAKQVLATWEEWTAIAETVPGRTRCYALLAAMSGDSDEARERAEATLELSEDHWDHLEATRALGIAALRSGDPALAAEHLGAVWEHGLREGVEELGTFPVAAELVQALSELGRSEPALAVAARVRKLADSQQHPWALATAARCEGTIALASDWDEQAELTLTGAAAAYGSLGLESDRARTLLALGRSQRRYRKWGAARASLELAASAFEQLGANGWVSVAREELERVGARRPAAEGELTSAEERVASLAARGLSNKEIASTLVVSVHTVEAHLSHSYAKLGVRSRTQLAGALAGLG